MFDYIIIPLSPNGKKNAGKYTTIIDAEDHDLAELTWQATASWWGSVYATRSVKFPYEKPFIFSLHLIIAARRYGRTPQPNEVIDHIDGNPLNNRGNNLRFATHQQNIWNKRINANSRNKYKGVKLIADGTRYAAYINVSGKQISLGRKFFTEASAARAYNEGALYYYGEFARLNDIPDDEE